jgi:hypothetical protein
MNMTDVSCVHVDLLIHLGGWAPSMAHNGVHSLRPCEATIIIISSVIWYFMSLW